MSTDPEAILFYGVLISDRYKYHDVMNNHKDVIFYGWDGELRAALAIESSIVRSEWCEYNEVSSIKVGDKWDAYIEKQCKDLKIPYPKPKWYLVSLYL